VWDYSDLSAPVQVGEFRTANSLGLGAQGSGDYSIHNALVTQGLADRAYIYRGPVRLSGGLHSALTDISQYRLLSREMLGPDVLESYAFTV
jgi:hypothetical protein